MMLLYLGFFHRILLFILVYVLFAFAGADLGFSVRLMLKVVTVSCLWISRTRSALSTMGSYYFFRPPVHAGLVLVSPRQ